MQRIRRALTIGIVTGLVGLVLAAVPPIATLEDWIGLRLLFLIRGPLSPPPNVVVVSIDEPSALRLGLPQRIRDWPRSAHGALVDRLVQRGASTIAFDIEFLDDGAEGDDDEFGRAIAKAGRVVLVQRLDVLRAGSRELWVRRNPVPTLSDVAAALAPVPVPDTPVVSWFWTFLRDPGAGDVPTLPAVVLQLQAIDSVGSLLDLLTRAGVEGLDDARRTSSALRDPADLLQLMQTLRDRVRAHPAAAARAMASLEAASAAGGPLEDRDALAALVEMYSGPETAYLNFYGPPGTVCTVSYHQVVTASAEEEGPCPLRDAMVFVGAGPGAVARTDQDDTYHTVNASPNGADFSGVELHATAAANLLMRSTVHPPPTAIRVAIVLLLGLVAGAGGFVVRSRARRVCGRFSARLQAAGVVAVIGAVYAAVAYLLFVTDELTIPLVIPVAFQVPLAIILGLLTAPTTRQEQILAVCMFTDGEGSTALGQRVAHEHYVRLLKRYNQELSRPVRVHSGAPVDPEGDGFISVWWGRRHGPDAREIDAQTRLQACVTAIEIADIANRFDLDGRPGGFPARIGLTLGMVTIESNADRGVFKVIGNPVNVAAKLQKCNSAYGSRVLALEPVVNGLETRVRLRPVGPIALEGVDDHQVVFEVIGLMRPAVGHLAEPRSKSLL